MISEIISKEQSDAPRAVRAPVSPVPHSPRLGAGLLWRLPADRQARLRLKGAPLGSRSLRGNATRVRLGLRLGLGGGSRKPEHFPVYGIPPRREKEGRDF